MAEHPWHPRVLPYILYVLLLLATFSLRQHWGWLFIPAYVIQCGLVAAMLWRYRRLTPELNLRFHWLALPTGVGVFLVWIALGQYMVLLFPNTFDDTGWNYYQHMSRPVAHVALGFKLLGMSLLVPLFEELFARSLLLRSFSSFRQTAIGLLQFLHDMPVLGDWIMNTSLGSRAGRHAPVFGRQFERTAMGVLTPAGLLVSTVIFTSGHVMRDWPGAVFCALAYSLLLALTRHKGLGPVVWAHGLTNALIWFYTLYSGDWMFM